MFRQTYGDRREQTNRSAHSRPSADDHTCNGIKHGVSGNKHCLLSKVDPFWHLPARIQRAITPLSRVCTTEATHGFLGRRRIPANGSKVA